MSQNAAASSFEDFEFVRFPGFSWGVLPEEVIVDYFLCLVCNDCIHDRRLALKIILLECLSHELKPSRI